MYGCYGWPCCEYEMGYQAGSQANLLPLTILAAIAAICAVVTLYSVVRLLAWRRTPWKW
jgi:hypothetical protein